MKVLFIENFDYNGAPDSYKWLHETGGFGWGNNELQYYTDTLNNAYVKNGKLVIKVIKEKYDRNEYTSAKLTTFGKKSFKYGSFRICAKLPSKKGLWPAIWLLPESYKNGLKWPDCGEIDILEMVTREMGRMVYSLHSKRYNFRTGNQLTTVVHFDCYDKFSEYRMDWTKNSFKYYIDEKLVGEIKKPSNATFDEWPFDEKFYLILNVAVGGEWCQNPDDDFTEDTMEIKYVKVVDIDDEC